MNRHLQSLMLVVLAGACVCACPRASAQQDPNEPDFEIPTTHIEVRVLPKDHVPRPDLLPEGTDEAPPRPEDPLEAVQYDVETIRDELRLLQATLDLLINQIMKDLRAENETLRSEIQRLHDLQERYGMPDSARVPRPGIDLIREVLEAQQNVSPEPDQPVLWPAMPEPAQEPDREPAPFEFTIFQEWGRTPEMVAELGGEATSLKGIVGIVPRDSYRDDIEDLGRDLRRQYDAYDNINIEVFDDEAAAQHFMETQVGHPNHRVLSISKHAASGRDIILYVERGEAHAVEP